MDRFITRTSSSSEQKTVVRNLEVNDADFSKDGSEGKRKRSSADIRPAKIRKYDEVYIEYGFMVCPSSKGVAQPQCVICSQVLSNESMKPCKLLRHLQTKHSQYKDKPKDFFVRKAKELSGAQAGMKTTAMVDKKLAKISYVISQKICQQKVYHTAGENLIMPCAIEIVKEMFGEEKAKAVAKIPISNNTVKRRISSMAEDILMQCTARLHDNDFAIQLDESTDSYKMSHLLACVRYEWENEIREDFLFCKDLKMTTTAKDVFETLDAFMKNNGINWVNCIGVCTDGAAAMTGRHKGVVQRIKEYAPRAVSTHCFLHRETLAAKDIEPELHEVMNTVITIINFVKSRATNSRLFTALCEAVGADYHSLLFHTEVRWLSHGRMLTRVFDLREELCTFLSEKKPDLAECLGNEKRLLQLSYLADLLNEINKLNKQMQDTNTNNIYQHERVEAFKRKLKLWNIRIESGATDMFAQMNAFIQEKCIDFDIIKHQIKVH